MALNLVSSGRDVPNEINVIIEIPKDAEPVKYEVDKATGAIFVDRVLSTPMRYPCNYGYVPHTIGGDGDPVDVLVLMPLPLIPGAVIRCRPIAVMRMTDEAGEDSKIVAAPAADHAGFDTATISSLTGSRSRMRHSDSTSFNPARWPRRARPDQNAGFSGQSW